MQRLFSFSLCFSFFICVQALTVGDLYIGFGGGSSVIRKVSPDGVVSNTGISNPGGISTGVVFEGENIYVSHDASGQIIKHGNELGTASSVFASGLVNPADMGFDAEGNLYVAEFGGGRISKITSSGVVSTFASGLSGVVDVSFNSAGELFVTEHNGNRITKITSDGSASTFFNLNGPGGVVVDSNGNVYANEHFTGQIFKISEDGNSSSLLGTVGSNPEGMAIDENDNLYVGLNNGQIIRFDEAGNSSLFASTSGDIDQLEFFGVSVFSNPVPEPSTWLLLGLGFLLWKKRGN